MPYSWTPWIVACQALLSVGFPRQEYLIGLLFASAGDLPNGVRKHEVFGKFIGLAWKFVEQYFAVENGIKENEQLDPSANRYLRVIEVGKIRMNMSKDPAE